MLNVISDNGTLRKSFEQFDDEKKKKKMGKRKAIRVDKTESEMNVC